MVRGGEGKRNGQAAGKEARTSRTKEGLGTGQGGTAENGMWPEELPIWGHQQVSG